MKNKKILVERKAFVDAVRVKGATYVQKCRILGPLATSYYIHNDLNDKLLFQILADFRVTLM